MKDQEFDTRLEDAVYLHLFHGRKSLTEDMDNWGDDGPTFGPLSFVHTTYGETIHLGDMRALGDALGDLTVRDGCVYYDGVWYGDWSVWKPLADGCTDDKLSEFDESKAVPPPAGGEPDEVLTCIDCNLPIEDAECMARNNGQFSHLNACPMGPNDPEESELLKLARSYQADVETRIEVLRDERLELLAYSPDDPDAEDYVAGDLDDQIAHWTATLDMINKVLEGRDGYEETR